MKNEIFLLMFLYFDILHIVLNSLIFKNAESSESDVELFSHLSFTKILPVLDHISSFVSYVKKIVENTLLQLSALYSEDNRSDGVHAGAAHFQVCYLMERSFGVIYE